MPSICRHFSFSAQTWNSRKKETKQSFYWIFSKILSLRLPILVNSTFRLYISCPRLKHVSFLSKSSIQGQVFANPSVRSFRFQHFVVKFFFVYQRRSLLFMVQGCKRQQPAGSLSTKRLIYFIDLELKWFCFTITDRCYCGFYGCVFYFCSLETE